MNKNEDVFADLADLYELSLNIGKSLDLQKNNEYFFNSLIPRKGLNGVFVWVKQNKKWENIFAFPNQHYNTQVLDLSYLEKLYRSSKFGCGRMEIPINKLGIQDLASLKDSHVCKHEDVLLLLTKSNNSVPFSNRQLHQLTSILEKYALSVKACLAHLTLNQEVERRKEAENKLYRSEQMYRFGANSLSEGIIVTDLKDKITYVNDAMENITGYSREEMLSSKAHEIFLPEEDWPEFSQRLNERGQGVEETYEVEHVHKDGHSYWVRITASPFKNEKQEIVGSIASFLDITERVHQRSEIDQAKRRLEDLVDNMYDAMVVLDDTSKIVDSNPAAQKLLGYDKNEILNVSLKDIVHAEDIESSKSYLKKLKEEGYYSDYQGRIIDKKGTVKHIEVNSTAIIENGVFKGSRDIIRDISDRIQAEAHNASMRKRLQLIVDSALDAVITIDEKGVISDWNVQAENIFGFTKKEAEGSILSQLIVPHQFREAHDRGMAHFLKTGEGPVLNQRIEIVGLNKAGETFPIELAISPAKQEGKHFFTAFVRDISERKKNEEQRERLISEIQSANKELKDFAYVVSHDLKAPLRSIGSLASWLEEDYTDKLDEKGQEIIGLLSNRTKRMHKLIEGVLDYSRVGRQEQKKEEVDTFQLTKDIVDYLGTTENIEFIIDQNLPKVYFDPTRLQQVLQNLISNGIKFMDKPNGRIEIGLAENNEDEYVLFVKDNGPGIDQIYHDKVFQIFQTLKAKDEFESTGIGLSICKRILESGGGRIWIDSELGKGTSFIFTVPKKK